MLCVGQTWAYKPQNILSQKQIYDPSKKEWFSDNADCDVMSNVTYEGTENNTEA